MRAPALLAIAVLCTLLPFAGQVYGDRAGGWLMIDFRAYYCASLAQREGHNPYFATSLHACEAATPRPYYRPPKNVTVPAPYPPYALAFFYPLTFLPFAQAAIAWWIVLALSLALAAAALSRIAAQPFLIGWGALVLSLGLVSWSSGNLVPFSMAMVIAGALCVQRGYFWAAAVAIVLAAIEPQIALPAAIALFVRYRALRLGLALGYGALGVACLVTSGLPQTIFYVVTVLPAHALSEVSRDNQYSISTVLTALGISDSAAVVVGSVSYVAMSVVGILAGLRLGRRYGNPALVLLVPPAFALLGGSFVHTGEVAAAVPAALCLFAHGRCRAWLFLALILLAIPWMLATSAAMFLAPLYPAAYLAYALWQRDRTLGLAVGAASFALIVGLFSLAALPGGHGSAGSQAVHPPIDPRLAEYGWRQLVLGNTTNKPVMWLLRLPTWAGLLAFAGTAIALARKAPLPLGMEGRLLESRA
jgi:hypothetical protein